MIKVALVALNKVAIKVALVVLNKVHHLKVDNLLKAALNKVVHKVAALVVHRAVALVVLEMEKVQYQLAVIFKTAYVIQTHLTVMDL